MDDLMPPDLPDINLGGFSYSVPRKRVHEKVPLSHDLEMKKGTRLARERVLLHIIPLGTEGGEAAKIISRGGGHEVVHMIDGHHDLRSEEALL